MVKNKNKIAELTLDDLFTTFICKIEYLTHGIVVNRSFKNKKISNSIAFQHLYNGS